MSVRGASLANAANCCASFCGSGPWRSSDQSASWCNDPRSKTTSRASTPFRRSACTFSQGIPAMFTGACVTLSCGRSVTVSCVCLTPAVSQTDMSWGLSPGHVSCGLVRVLHQLRIVERDEVHREAGAHRLPRLRVAEHDLAPVRDPVDGALAAGCELHHEQVGPVLVG